MIEELGKLIDSFCRQYGIVEDNKEILSKQQYELMLNNLLAQYKAEYKLLLLRNEIKEKRALYDAELRYYMLVPRKRFFLFRNRAMKQLDAKILDELETWFTQREQSEASGSAREELPLGWEERKREPETAEQTAAAESNQAAEPAQTDTQQQPAQPESIVADNAGQPAEQAQPGAQETVEQNDQGAASEQPAALPEQKRSKKRNAAAQVPGQLSLLNV